MCPVVKWSTSCKVYMASRLITGCPSTREAGPFLAIRPGRENVRRSEAISAHVPHMHRSSADSIRLIQVPLRLSRVVAPASRRRSEAKVPRTSPSEPQAHPATAQSPLKKMTTGHEGRRRSCSPPPRHEGTSHPRGPPCNMPSPPWFTTRPSAPGHSALEAADDAPRPGIQPHLTARLRTWPSSSPRIPRPPDKEQRRSEMGGEPSAVPETCRGSHHPARRDARCTHLGQPRQGRGYLTRRRHWTGRPTGSL